jgi:hypothetical protein
MSFIFRFLEHHLTRPCESLGALNWMYVLTQDIIIKRLNQFCPQATPGQSAIPRRPGLPRAKTLGCAEYCSPPACPAKIRYKQSGSSDTYAS